MLSILYPSSACRQKAENRRALPKAYMAEETFLRICPDVKERAYFLSILSECPDLSAARFRAEAIRDFIGEKELATRIKARFSELNAVLTDSEDSRRRAFMLNDQKGSDSSVYAAFSRLNIASLSLARLLTVLHGAAEELSPLSLRSEALCRLKKRLAPFSDSGAYRDLLSLCTRYSDFSYEKGSFDLLVFLNDCAEIKESAFVQNTAAPSESGAKRGKTADGKSRFSLFSPRASDRHGQNVPNLSAVIGQYDSNIFLCRSVDALTNRFSAVIRAIKADFSEIAAETDFYDVAVRYAAFLAEIGVCTVFPVLSDDGNTDISELYDLYLLARDGSQTHVVPNDYTSEEKTSDILIKGDNGSGKTVYLRSVAVAHLLAAAGLPLPSKRAAVSLRTVYFLSASSKKNPNDAAANAGRFEEEVKALSEILPYTDRHSLVILNEVFQSTSYDEGAKGLYPILQYLSRKGVKWLAVTHMTALFGMFRDETVRKAQADKETHRICDIV